MKSISNTVGGGTSNKEIQFSEAQTRENITSGESLKTLFGKIKKWFTDLPSLFVSKSGDTMTGHLVVDRADGTSSTQGSSAIVLGNDIQQGTAGNSVGVMYFFGKNQYHTSLHAIESTDNRGIMLPDKSGTIALEPTEESGSLASYIQSGFTGDTDVTYYKKGNIVTIRSNGPVPSSTGSDQIFLVLPSNLATKIQTFSIVSNAAGTVLGLAYINNIYLAVNIATVGGMYFSITYQC